MYESNTPNTDCGPWQPITYPEPYVKPKKWRITEDGIFKYDRRMYSWDDLRADERAVMEDALNRLEEGV